MSLFGNDIEAQMTAHFSANSSILCCMRRTTSLLLAATVFIGLSIPIAQASTAVRAGSTCSKAGQAAISGGTKFTCSKVGNKLSWVTAVKTTSSNAQPSGVKPAPIPSPTPATFVPPVIPTSFGDLVEHASGIIYGAWLKGSQQVLAATPRLGNVTILVGPNTKEDDPNSLKSLKLASQLYSNFDQVKNLYIIKYGKADLDWAQTQYERFHPRNYDANYIKNQCQGTSGCVAANTGVTDSGDGVITAGQGGNYDGQPIVDGRNRSSGGQVMAHEYVHTIQMLLAPCGDTHGCYGDLPHWLIEGNAEYSGTAARFSANYNDYITFRSGKLGDLHGQYSQPNLYTADWITKYLNPNPTFIENQNNWSYWDSYARWDLYAIGLMVNEVLVDVKNPDAVMNLFKDVGNGDTFVQAFQKEFGMAWADACPIIAKAISVEIQQGIRR